MSDQTKQELMVIILKNMFGTKSTMLITKKNTMSTVKDSDSVIIRGYFTSDGTLVWLQIPSSEWVLKI